LYRGIKIRDVYPGEGIGLAMAKQIIALHGGDILVERPRKPTIIRITLPIVRLPDVDEFDDEPAIIRWDIPKKVV